VSDPDAKIEKTIGRSRPISANTEAASYAIDCPENHLATATIAGTKNFNVSASNITE